MKSKKPEKTRTIVGIDNSIMLRVDLWRASQDVPPTRTACVEVALREFLKKREKTK